MTVLPSYDDETLMRRVDGELSAEAGAAIDAAALEDPALAARLAALRAVGSAVRNAWPLAADPRDADLRRRIAAGAPSRSPAFAGGFAALWREAFQPRHALVWAGAAAACFVVGLLVGQIGERPVEGFALARDGGIADPALVRVLDRGLAADGPDAAGRAVALTFRDGDGRWCRTFQAAEDGVAGLACRHDGAWRLRALAPFTPAGGEVRTAGTEIPPPVLAAVDAAIVGETLDAADEARARDAGWR